ncbi:cellulose-binding protein [Saccharobesus litoralis]|uniref:Cellulose-binding protein n=1 Tax=Saccharobesus litoralis TaxID=2172099 RepID=A0A2S0VN62_9ALTE|nr:heme-binding protein [Saccharobesus litoralis]AWB65654.1 cellulose-binding protein [Saccharobesus litoralis]
MNTRGITLLQAQSILDSALALAITYQTPPLAIVILDNGGHVKVASCQDGVGTARFEIAQHKANAALAMGFDSGQFYQLVNNQVLPEMFATCINGATQGKFIPLPGGVLINHNKQTLGAIGISGASSGMDEKIALQAINSIHNVES